MQAWARIIHEIIVDCTYEMLICIRALFSLCVCDSFRWQTSSSKADSVCVWKTRWNEGEQKVVHLLFSLVQCTQRRARPPWCRLACRSESGIKSKLATHTHCIFSLFSRHLSYAKTAFGVSAAMACFTKSLRPCLSWFTLYQSPTCAHCIDVNTLTGIRQLMRDSLMRKLKGLIWRSSGVSLQFDLLCALSIDLQPSTKFTAYQLDSRRKNQWHMRNLLKIAYIHMHVVDVSVLLAILKLYTTFVPCFRNDAKLTLECKNRAHPFTFVQYPHFTLTIL